MNAPKPPRNCIHFAVARLVIAPAMGFIGDPRFDRVLARLTD
jgi:hypothetical protein